MIIGLLAFLVLLLLAFVGLPLGFAMFAIGIGFFTIERGFPAALSMSALTISDFATNSNLVPLPMFILMGTFIYRANLAGDLYDAASAWIGHYRGGLAQATVLASAGFASISGSSIATAATMAQVAIPHMRRHGYADSLAAGCVTSGGTLGALIPPSFPLLLYGILTSQDIRRLFLAGIGPAALLAILFMFTTWCVARLNPALAPPTPVVDWPTRLSKLYRVWGVLALFLVVIGGLYGGVFTASEASSIGATGALGFALLRRRLSFAGFFESLVAAAKTTANIFTIGFGALVFANFVSVSGLTGALVNQIQAMHLPFLGVMAAITIAYIVLGSVLEGLALVLLTVPIFASIVQPLGVNMIWFGVYVAIMLEIGLIHPPVGMNIFMVRAVRPDISVMTIFRGTLPFLAANFVALILIVVFPTIATGLLVLVK